MAGIYMAIRRKYASARGHNDRPKNILPTKAPIETGKNYGYFLALDEFLRQMRAEGKEIDTVKYIEAQFHFSKRIVLPRDLVAEYAVKRYLRYMEKKPWTKEEMESSAETDALKKSEDAVHTYMAVNNCGPDHRVDYNGFNVSFMTLMYLDGRLSHLYAAMNDRIMEDLRTLSSASLFDKKKLGRLHILRQKNLSGCDDECFIR